MKALLQGVDGGRTYNEYMASHRRSVELDEKMSQLKAQIQTLEQLVTMFTITASSNPASARHLSQLQDFVIEKRTELQTMVILFIAHKNVNMVSRNQQVRIYKMC